VTIDWRVRLRCCFCCGRRSTSRLRESREHSRTFFSDWVPVFGMSDSSCATGLQELAVWILPTSLHFVIIFVGVSASPREVSSGERCSEVRCEVQSLLNVERSGQRCPIIRSVSRWAPLIWWNDVSGLCFLWDDARRRLLDDGIGSTLKSRMSISILILSRSVQTLDSILSSYSLRIGAKYWLFGVLIEVCMNHSPLFGSLRLECLISWSISRFCEVIDWLHLTKTIRLNVNLTRNSSQRFTP
jgi:hypothetical protein